MAQAQLAKLVIAPDEELRVDFLVIQLAMIGTLVVRRCDFAVFLASCRSLCRVTGQIVPFLIAIENEASRILALLMFRRVCSLV